MQASGPSVAVASSRRAQPPAKRVDSLTSQLAPSFRHPSFPISECSRLLRLLRLLCSIVHHLRNIYEAGNSGRSVSEDRRINKSRVGWVSRPVRAAPDEPGDPSYAALFRQLLIRRSLAKNPGSSPAIETPSQQTAFVAIFAFFGRLDIISMT